jgi:hypothetical protein
MLDAGRIILSAIRFRLIGPSSLLSSKYGEVIFGNKSAITSVWNFRDLGLAKSTTLPLIYLKFIPVSLQCDLPVFRDIQNTI